MFGKWTHYPLDRPFHTSFVCWFTSTGACLYRDFAKKYNCIKTAGQIHYKPVWHISFQQQSLQTPYEWCKAVTLAIAATPSPSPPALLWSHSWQKTLLGQVRTHTWCRGKGQQNINLISSNTVPVYTQWICFQNNCDCNCRGRWRR